MKKVLFLVVVMACVLVSCGNNAVELNVAIGQQGEEIVITNNDSFDYNDTKLQINESYEYRSNIIRAGETIRINKSEFSDSDGNRFDDSKKTKEIFVFCKLENEKDGFASGIFE